MQNEPIGSPGAEADRNRAEGGSGIGEGTDQSALSAASPGAASDRNRARKEAPGENITEELNELSPGFTAEAEADSS